MSGTKIYSVGQINNYIKNMFSQDYVLNRVSVRGEVSNCKYHTSGHIYFSLKDAAGAIACVMFAGARKGLAFRMSNGQQVVVNGYVNVYERDGKYQLYANSIQQDGAGVLYERFLALKNELEEMGMFDREYKKPIPGNARRVGIVTAPTGAAVRDIINVATRRNPGIQLILYPAKVQGEGAAESVAEGIMRLDRLDLDVIIAGRGGGSIEDLWAFNEEIVARAIFACDTPVISAVGHETDTTIADFVADLRAPTPSAAAEIAVADIGEIIQKTEDCAGRLARGMQWHLEKARMRATQFRTLLQYADPQHKIREQRMRTIDLEDKLRQQMAAVLLEKKHTMSVLIQRMRGNSPLDKLAQGYAVASCENGEKIFSVEQTVPGDPIQIFVSDGKIDAVVEQTEKITSFATTEADGKNHQFRDTGGCGKENP